MRVKIMKRIWILVALAAIASFICVSKKTEGTLAQTQNSQTPRTAAQAFKNIQVIKDMPADTIFIAGHARAGEPPTVPRAAVIKFRDYFDAVLTLVKKGIAAGQSKETITATPSLTGFENYQPLTATINLGAVLGVTYDELTAK